MTIRLPISEARARLPELAQRAMDLPGERITIEHRDRKERVVLVAEDYLDMLEDQLMKLKEMQGPPFKLAGSIATDLDPDELDAAITQNRARQRAAEAEKQRRLNEA